jgi:hypothetical protein
MTELIKRTRVYIQRPEIYGMSACACGNRDPEWSEYKRHLWCPICKIDFIPLDAGLFDGPIGIHACEMFGIYFDMLDMETFELIPDPCGTLHFRKKTAEELAAEKAEREATDGHGASRVVPSDS